MVLAVTIFVFLTIVVIVFAFGAARLCPVGARLPPA